MRTLPLTVHKTCPGHSQKSVLLQLILDLCTEGHQGQVWLCLLILGVLCRCTWAYSGPDPSELQVCLDELTNAIKKSDALLYTPSVDGATKESCHGLLLSCYMLELKMVFFEEQLENDYTNCVFDFIDRLNNNVQAHTGSCPPCEAATLKNSTMFLRNLKDFLEMLMSYKGKRSTL